MSTFPPSAFFCFQRWNRKLFTRKKSSRKLNNEKRGWEALNKWLKLSSEQMRKQIFVFLEGRGVSARLHARVNISYNSFFFTILNLDNLIWHKSRFVRCRKISRDDREKINKGNWKWQLTHKLMLFIMPVRCERSIEK